MWWYREGDNILLVSRFSIIIMSKMRRHETHCMANLHIKLSQGKSFSAATRVRECECECASECICECTSESERAATEWLLSSAFHSG